MLRIGGVGALRAMKQGSALFEGSGFRIVQVRRSVKASLSLVCPPATALSFGGALLPVRVIGYCCFPSRTCVFLIPDTSKCLRLVFLLIMYPLTGDQESQSAILGCDSVHNGSNLGSSSSKRVIWMLISDPRNVCGRPLRCDGGISPN